MLGQLDEAHAAVICEKEAAKQAIEQAPPVIKEVPVVDNTKIELLENHNEELEVNLNTQSPIVLKQFAYVLYWKHR